jgi:aminoglycoside 6'-N-acetyltransferase
VTTLQGAQVTLRPPTEADVPELARIRTTEEVHRWWRGGEDMTKAVADDLAQPDVET